MSAEPLLLGEGPLLVLTGEAFGFTGMESRRCLKSVQWNAQTQTIFQWCAIWSTAANFNVGGTFPTARALSVFASCMSACVDNIRLSLSLCCSHLCTSGCHSISLTTVFSLLSVIPMPINIIILSVHIVFWEPCLFSKLWMRDAVSPSSWCAESWACSDASYSRPTWIKAQQCLFSHFIHLWRT